MYQLTCLNFFAMNEGRVRGGQGWGSRAESLQEAGKSGTFHTQILFDAFPAPLRDLGTRMTARPNE